MKTFLQMVAEDLYHKIGADLSRTAVVFPNKRAGLFFNEHLAALADRPLWSPAYVTISELFRRLSPLKAGDPIQLVIELYKVFVQETGSSETLDDFYFWGELLISDFDDVDKNLVDAGRLFTNLHDLKAIMDIPDYLDAEQEEAVRQFFSHFSIERRTVLKERFISLWDKLGGIYNRYRDRLQQLGIAYEGMMYRQVLEQLQQVAAGTAEKTAGTLPGEYDRYVFVGFNVLNKVETAFFTHLQEAGKALFYWDYDLFYTTLPRQQQPPYTHEAGEFILRNLQQFPNQLDSSAFDVMRLPKRVTYASASTDNAQARYVGHWMEEICLKQPDGTPTTAGKENAVVLCDESLLLPVLHSIPDGVKDINITMGFPLTQTPVYSFINALLELQTTGYRPDDGRYLHEAVLTVLKHPYCRRLSAAAEATERHLTENNRFYPLPSELKGDTLLELLFTPCEGTAPLCRYLTKALQQVATLFREDQEQQEGSTGQLYRESLFKAYTVINRLAGLMENGQLTLRPDTLKRLVERLLGATSIPFHGEPAIGLQIMGVLETRNLDFRNLILLSLNEGKLPKAGGEASFIPYNLRKAFGMTTIEHKNSVYAYYFYRLIQRAENVTLVYNHSTSGLNRGEMSRFMLQLQVEWPHPVTHLHLVAGQAPRQSRHISIEKTPEVMERLCRRFDAAVHPGVVLSPSALNTYLDCPMRFYYRYVAGLSVPEEVSSEIDSALFGTIFHRTAELIYTDLTAHGPEVRKEDIESLLGRSGAVETYVDRAFKEHFFHIAPQEKAEYNGLQLIHLKVIASYVTQLLRHDLRYAPFCMEGMEQRVTEEHHLPCITGRLTLHIGGTIDRLDRKGDTLRIVDYKTGGAPKTLKEMDQLFGSATEGRPGYIFQTFLYASIMSRRSCLKIQPALLYIHRAAADDYSPLIRMGPPRGAEPVLDFAPLEQEFRTRLDELLQEIFQSDRPFIQTDDRSQCGYCDFCRICRR